MSHDLTAARARLARMGRVLSLTVRPSGGWVTVDATVGVGGRTVSVHGTAPTLAAALTAAGVAL